MEARLGKMIALRKDVDASTNKIHKLHSSPGVISICGRMIHGVYVRPEAETKCRRLSQRLITSLAPHGNHTGYPVDEEAMRKKRGEVKGKGTYSVWDLVICGRCLISHSLRHFTNPEFGLMQALYLFTKENAYSYDMPYFLMRYAMTTEALREMPLREMKQSVEESRI